MTIMKKMNLCFIGLSFFVFSCNNASDNHLSATNKDAIPASPSFEALQNDDDIIWMAEHDIDCSPNFDSHTSSSEDKKLFAEVGFTEKNTIKILKCQVQSIEESPNGMHLLTHKIINHRDALVCYKDAAMTTLLSSKEKEKLMGYVDTIVSFDPETNEELIQLVVNSTNPDDILFFKVKHLLYYSKKEMMFKMKALAIAPMIMDYNDDLQYLGMKAMFWTPVDDLVQTPNINNKDNTWATRVYHDFSVENLNVLKGDNEIMIDDLSENANDIYIAHTFDEDGTQKMSAEEINQIKSFVDISTVSDSNTLKEKVPVVNNKFKINNVKQIRFLQDWVWNHEEKSLSITYLGFKPIITRYTNTGKFLNAGPMFTRRVGWDGKK